MSFSKGKGRVVEVPERVLMVEAERQGLPMEGRRCLDATVRRQEAARRSSELRRFVRR